jgi:hypothetical protein
LSCASHGNPDGKQPIMKTDGQKKSAHRAIMGATCLEKDIE